MTWQVCLFRVQSVVVGRCSAFGMCHCVTVGCRILVYFRVCLNSLELIWNQTGIYVLVFPCSWISGGWVCELDISWSLLLKGKKTGKCGLHSNKERRQDIYIACWCQDSNRLLPCRGTNVNNGTFLHNCPPYVWLFHWQNNRMALDKCLVLIFPARAVPFRGTQQSAAQCQGWADM